MAGHASRRQAAAPAVAALAVAALLASGCGDGEASGPCGPITREALDPAYLVHVLGDDGSVEYTSDPPTSGPHQPAPPIDGVVDEPLSRPVQVGVLEKGDVLIQHDPGLDEGELDRLRDLSGEGVVIAPNADLSAPVVATAWLFKRTCDGVDSASLEEFIEERAGRGPEA